MNIIYCQSKIGLDSENQRHQLLFPVSASPTQSCPAVAGETQDSGNVLRQAAAGAEFGDWVSCAGHILPNLWRCLVFNDLLPSSLCSLLQSWLCWTPSVNTSSWVVTKRFSQEKPLSLAQHIWICVGLQRNDKWYRNYRNRLILWIFSWCHHPLPKNSSCPSFSLCRLEETTRAGWTCGDS